MGIYYSMYVFDCFVIIFITSGFQNVREGPFKKFTFPQSVAHNHVGTFIVQVVNYEYWILQYLFL